LYRPTPGAEGRLATLGFVCGARQGSVGNIPLIDIGAVEVQYPFVLVDPTGRCWSFEKFKTKTVLKVKDQLRIVTYFQPKELIVRHQSIFGIVLEVDGKASRFDPDTDEAFRPVEKFNFGHGIAKIRREIRLAG
jgi:hypothetical protein